MSVLLLHTALDAGAVLGGGILLLLNERRCKKNRKVMEENFQQLKAEATRRAAAEKEITYLAFYDQVSGLPNKQALFNKMLSPSGETCGNGRLLMILDIKQIRHVGELLSEDDQARTVKAIVEKVQDDPRVALMARTGESMLAILLICEGQSSTKVLEAAAQGIQWKLSNEMLVLPCKSMHLQAPAGYVTFMADENDAPEHLYQRAEIALKEAKTRGSSRCLAFDADMEERATAYQELINDLQQAIHRDQISLQIQPQVDTAGKIVAGEGLLRWNHPHQGWVPPTTFIPIAERMGLISYFGQYAIEQACLALQQADEKNLVVPEHLSINISPWQLLKPAFVDQLVDITERHEIPPHKILLELTETTFLIDRAGSIGMLNHLRMLGFQISLDDFGTGYSSFAYLHTLPISQIKIDKSFVQQITAGSSPLIKNILAIAKEMGLSVVAEGVETQAQFDILKDLGTERFQGYLFSAAVPGQDFLKMLPDQHNPTPTLLRA